jgi:hypothetical protein
MIIINEQGWTSDNHPLPQNQPGYYKMLQQALYLDRSFYMTQQRENKYMQNLADVTSRRRTFEDQLQMNA